MEKCDLCMTFQGLAGREVQWLEWNMGQGKEFLCLVLSLGHLKNVG